MTRLTVGDARKAGFCCRGQRQWAKRVGIDMRLFVQEGVDINTLGHINDAKLDKAIEIAKMRERDHGC